MDRGSLHARKRCALVEAVFSDESKGTATSPTRDPSIVQITDQIGAKRGNTGKMLKVAQCMSRRGQ